MRKEAACQPAAARWLAGGIRNTHVASICEAPVAPAGKAAKRLEKAAAKTALHRIWAVT